eukprot:m.22638 g.22638  ORF g.22638 m.22638 type:complete len:610 (-) comp7420_c0_seq1:37-1866(-)
MSPRNANDAPRKRKRRPEKIKSRDKLEDIRELGQGAFGKVILVRIRKGGDQQKYALKELDRATVTREQLTAQVHAERDILFSISSHPYVVKLYAYWESSKTLYFLMHYVDGGDMFDYVKDKKKVDPDLAARFLLQMAEALQYIGDNGIVYRDLKLENILISETQNSVFLADFGLAKNLRGSSKTSTICGTIQYMAPEILQNTQYGREVDWWSLGVLTFLMLVGKYPYAKGIGKLAFDRSEADRMLMYQRIEQGLVNFPEDMPQDVKECVQSLLQPDPNVRVCTFKRLQSCAWLQNIEHKDESNESNPNVSFESATDVSLMNTSQTEERGNRSWLSWRRKKKKNVNHSNISIDDSDPKNRSWFVGMLRSPFRSKSHRGANNASRSNTSTRSANERLPDQTAEAKTDVMITDEVDSLLQALDKVNGSRLEDQSAVISTKPSTQNSLDSGLQRFSSEDPLPEDPIDVKPLQSSTPTRATRKDTDISVSPSDFRMSTNLSSPEESNTSHFEQSSKRRIASAEKIVPKKFLDFNETRKLPEPYVRGGSGRRSRPNESIHRISLDSSGSPLPELDLGTEESMDLKDEVLKEIYEDESLHYTANNSMKFSGIGSEV